MTDLSTLPDPGISPSPETTPAPSPSDWRTYLTEDLKADPVVSGWSEKASEKDIPSILKGYAHAQKRMGSAINLPGRDAKPDEVSALRAKLYESGVFTAPPATPEDYGLSKPDAMPAGVAWSAELSGKFAAALHKHGVPKAALADLLPLYQEAVHGAAGEVTTDFDSGMTQLKHEFGEKFDEHLELAGRMVKGIFTTDAERALYDRLGLGNDPRFLGPLLRLAPLMAQDSAFIDALPVEGGGKSGEDVRAEMAKIMSDKTHPMYEGYKRRDPKVERYIDNLYKQAYGNKPVNLGEGVSV